MISKQLLWPGHRRTPRWSSVASTSSPGSPTVRRQQGTVARPAEPRPGARRDAPGALPATLGFYGSRAGERTPSTRRSPRTLRPPSRPASTRRRPKLPSESELAQRYGVSRGHDQAGVRRRSAPTGRSASRRGARRGCGVRGPRVQSFGELLVLLPLGPGGGRSPGRRRADLLDRRPATPLEVARLAIADYASVYALIRVRLLSGLPGHDRARRLTPNKVCVLVSGLDLSRTRSPNGSRSSVSCSPTPSTSSTRWRRRLSGARWLRVRAGVPLLRERRFTTDRAGQPVEWSDDRYLSTETRVQRAQLDHRQRALPATPPPASETRLGPASISPVGVIASCCYHVGCFQDAPRSSQVLAIQVASCIYFLLVNYV